MKKILTLISVALAAIACFPDDRDNFMVDDSFGITAQDALQDASVHTGFYTFGISKNGKGLSAASVTVAYDAQVLDAYNASNNTAYKAVPEQYVTLDQNLLSYSEKDVVKDVTIRWNAIELTGILGEDTDYVIPVSIRSEDKTVKVAKGKDVIMVHLYKTSLSVSQKNIARRIDRTKVEVDKEGNQPSLTETLVIDLKLDQSIKGVGVSLPIKIDNSLIPQFSEEKGEEYVAAPDGLVTILDDCAAISESKQSGNFKLLLDKSKLMSGGKLQAFPNYVIPIRLDKDKLSSSRYGKDISLEGLDFGNLTTYVSITYLELKPGTYISRDWGLYSTDTDSWNSYFGGTANAERNVTLDDNNIYIAEFNSTKNLWAINLKNPESVKKLPVGTVESTGNANIYLACSRVLPNTDEKVNGGKDVLAVCNLSGDGFQTLKMYFYIDGIDKDPSSVTFQIWQERRLGDTFSFWGTLQKGMFYMKDFDDANAVVTFKMENRFTGSNSVQGRFVMPSTSETKGAAGAYWPYPEDKNKGIYGLRNKVNAFAVSLMSDSWEATGGNETTSTQFDETYMNSAFQLISYNDKRYVAYTNQPADNDGRFYVLEGEATDSWDSIMQSHKVIYSAVIQNDTESFGGELEDVQGSPKGSTHNGMDLYARKVGDDVLIAVVKQNVGLSLFRMTVIE